MQALTTVFSVLPTSLVVLPSFFFQDSKMTIILDLQILRCVASLITTVLYFLKQQITSLKEPCSPMVNLLENSVILSVYVFLNLCSFQEILEAESCVLEVWIVLLDSSTIQTGKKKNSRDPSLTTFYGFG